MPVLQIRIDDFTKKKASEIYNKLGFDLSTAIRVFLKKSILEGGFPFDTKLDTETLNALLALDDIRNASEKNGNSGMTLEEINDEIRKVREAKKTK